MVLEGGSFGVVFRINWGADDPKWDSKIIGTILWFVVVDRFVLGLKSIFCLHVVCVHLVVKSVNILCSSSCQKCQHLLLLFQQHNYFHASAVLNKEEEGYNAQHNVVVR